MKLLSVFVEGLPVQREGDVESGQHPEYRVEQVVKHTAARSKVYQGVGGGGGLFTEKNNSDSFFRRFR